METKWGLFMNSMLCTLHKLSLMREIDMKRNTIVIRAKSRAICLAQLMVKKESLS